MNEEKLKEVIKDLKNIVSMLEECVEPEDEHTPSSSIKELREKVEKRNRYKEED